MSRERGKSADLRASCLRVAVLVLVITYHLGLWMLLLRPVVAWHDRALIVGSKSPVLQLRFMHVLHPSSQRPPLPTLPSVRSAVRSRAKLSARSSKPPAAGQPPISDQQSHRPASTDEAISAAVTDPSANDGSSNDGGFLERLHDAQRSDLVHQVPGSDTTYAPGIHLVDPMNQGIGAIMRTTQRAFGITSSHCVDVAVWRHLTPQELSARHISPDDVDKADAKYRCNDPPGLHF